MKGYTIKFCVRDEEPQFQSYRATSPGDAFARCLRDFPGAKLLEAFSEGGLREHYGCITYAPPSTVRSMAQPTPKEEETTFPFFDACRGSRWGGTT
jgi:hypothetical protein